ncbi:acyltransferase [Stenotrophomonas geniculata]|uniref:acyltransferase family protein n=1 Tax=Stenotrophomonas geniculata TaxID=86188 RepID=UPI00287FC46B|nr:acyltransferase [Stenotrophomonas geniculata]WNF10277.1 acyltransferase [Stenotrophomonas geniculata]
MKKELRNSWVDHAKALGIILVVYGHVARGLVSAGIMHDSDLYRLIDSVIYSFHMPLFFFLSGLFFVESRRRRGISGTLATKIDTILYPFIVWSIIQGGIEVSLSNYTNGSLAWRDVFQMFWQPRAQFWFLYALFFVFALALIIYKSQSSRSILTVLAISSAAYILQGLLADHRIILYIADNFVFFALGVAFTHFSLEDRTGNRDALVKCASVVLLVFIALEIALHSTGKNYTDKGFISLSAAMAGIFMIVFISMITACAGIRILGTVGAMSMSIYLMHIISGSGARILFGKIMGIHDPGTHLALGTLAGLFIPLLAALAMNRIGMDFLFAPPKLLSAGRRLERLRSAPRSNPR